MRGSGWAVSTRWHVTVASVGGLHHTSESLCVASRRSTSFSRLRLLNSSLNPFSSSSRIFSVSLPFVGSGFVSAGEEMRDMLGGICRHATSLSVICCCYGRCCCCGMMHLIHSPPKAFRLGASSGRGINEACLPLRVIPWLTNYQRPASCHLLRKHTPKFKTEPVFPPPSQPPAPFYLASRS